MENISRVASAVKSFQANRENLNDYYDTLDELLLDYVKTDEYATQTLSNRCKIVNCIIELKLLIHRLREARKTQEC